jgi:hypothetical protein
MPSFPSTTIIRSRYLHECRDAGGPDRAARLECRVSAKGSPAGKKQGDRRAVERSDVAAATEQGCQCQTPSRTQCAGRRCRHSGPCSTTWRTHHPTSVHVDWRAWNRLTDRWTRQTLSPSRKGCVLRYAARAEFPLLFKKAGPCSTKWKLNIRAGQQVDRS